MARKKNSSKTVTYVLAGVGVVILAVGAGLLSGSWAAGNSKASAATADGPAWINEIKERGELRVGCAEASPAITVQSDGTCTGPDLLPLQAVAETLDVEFVTVATTWQNIIAGLQAGQYDIAADLDQTIERTLSIQYTNPSWSYPAVFLVKRDSGITTADELLSSTTPVAVAQGTSQDRAISEVVTTEPLRVDNYQNAASAVNAGRATAVFTDLGVAVQNATEDPSWGIIVPTPRILEVWVSYGVPQNVDAQSLQVLNIAIDQAVLSGDMQRGFAEAGYIDVEFLGDLEIK